MSWVARATFVSFAVACEASVGFRTGRSLNAGAGAASWSGLTGAFDAHAEQIGGPSTVVANLKLKSQDAPKTLSACLDAVLKHASKDPTSSPFSILGACRREFMNSIYVYDRELTAAGMGFIPQNGIPADWHEGSKGGWEDMYAADQYVLHMIMQEDLGFITRNASEARMFWIPAFPTVLVNECLHTTGLRKCVNDVEESYLLPILREVASYPAWGRLNGADHVLVVTQDHGLECKLWKKSCAWLSGAIVWTPHLPRPGSLDVTIPPVTSNSWTVANGYKAVLKQPGTGGRLGPFGTSPCEPYAPSKHFLGVFRGNLHGQKEYSCGVRQGLHDVYHHLSGSLKSANILVGGKSSSFREEIDRALFCIAAPGWVPWTGRMYDYIAAGCPPVLFTHFPGCSDFHLGGDTPRPFLSILDWDSFSLSVDARRYNETHLVLLAAKERVCTMRKWLSEAHSFLLWKQEPLLVLQMALSQTLASIQNVTARLTRRRLNYKTKLKQLGVWVRRPPRGDRSR